MMKILGIETSCDETATALLEVKQRNFEIENKILKESLFSQVKLHQKYGGVYPSLAKREHQKNLIPLLKETLKDFLVRKKRKFSPKEYAILDEIFEKNEILKKEFLDFFKNWEIKKGIDLIVVTTGPGLEVCLWTGINLARALSFLFKIPLVEVNHLKAHFFSNFLEKKFSLKEKIFPGIYLLASGGHTELFLVKDFFNFKILGETLDDAAGECLDKVGRMLNLPYPGGPEIEKLAKKAKKSISFPSPMIHSKDFNFSFSGLKTAVFYYLQEKKEIKKIKKEVAKGVLEAIIKVLIKKTKKAVEKYKAKSIFGGGGVFANEILKENFKKEFKNFHLFLPLKKFSTDNAGMVALCGFFEAKKGKFSSFRKIKAKP